VVVNDDGWHLGRRQIWIIELANESSVVFVTESSCDELLTPPGWKKDDCVPQVNYGHPTAVVESPAVPDCRRD
jgi:hypothetical protein